MKIKTKVLPRIILLLLAIFCAASMPTETQAAETEGPLTYVIAQGKATITDCDENISGDFAIPAALGGCPVTVIADYAFCRCEHLTSITIPDSITTIGEYAFFNCSNLTNIAIPNSVTSIGIQAFSGSFSLNSITVDSKNTFYHSKENCLIETVSKTLLVGCNNSVIPSDGSVTSIGTGAFRNCAILTSVAIPNGVTSIGNSAFYGCTGLTSVTIPNSITSIGEFAFDGCYRLSSISLPASITHIGYSTFRNCSLSSITIPDSISSIDVNAFAGCNSLTSITIPSSVTSIGESAFFGCYNLWHVLFTGSQQQWEATNISVIDNNYLLTATRHYNCTGNEVTDPVNKVCTICTPTCAHAYDNACDTTCKLCGAIRNTSHTPGPAATATEDQICTVCGKVLNKATGGTTTTPPATEPPATAPTNEPTTEPSNTPTEPTTNPTTEPVESTPPTESATEPVESTPADTDPSGTDATQPENAATTPGNPAESETDNTIVIVSCAACLLLGAGGATAGIFLWKKKH